MELNEPLVSKIPEGTSFIRRTFQVKIGSMNLRPEYWQAGLILFMLFLILMTIARWRHLYVKWNLKGFIPSILFGFLVTLLLEGILIVSGRTFLTEILGWENAPKPISTALDEGRNKLIEVLGVTDSVPQAAAVNQPVAEEIILSYESLPDNEALIVEKAICDPEIKTHN